jgi:hypothetical protein
MNSRVYSVDREFIPEPSTRSPKPVQVEAEAVAFDKASDAASIEELRLEIEKIEKALAESAAAAGADDEGARSRLESRKSHLLEQIEREQERLREDALESKG